MWLKKSIFKNTVGMNKCIPKIKKSFTVQHTGGDIRYYIKQYFIVILTKIISYLLLMSCSFISNVRVIKTMKRTVNSKIATKNRNKINKMVCKFIILIFIIQLLT